MVLSHFFNLKNRSRKKLFHKISRVREKLHDPTKKFIPVFFIGGLAAKHKGDPIKCQLLLLYYVFLDQLNLSKHAESLQ